MQTRLLHHFWKFCGRETGNLDNVPPTFWQILWANIRGYCAGYHSLQVDNYSWCTNECLSEASGPRAILDEVTTVWMWSPRMWYMGVAPVIDVARILCHLLQDRMHCVVEIHNVTIWRAVNNTNYVCLTTEMKFSKYTFIMIINYIKFTEFSTCNFSAIYRHTATPPHSSG